MFLKKSVICLFFILVNGCFFFSQAQTIHKHVEVDSVFFPFQENGKWGFKDEHNHTVIQPFFDSVGRFEDGLAEVIVDYKYFYINKTGKIVKEKLKEGFTTQRITAPQNIATTAPAYRVSSSSAPCFPNFDFEEGDFTKWETNTGSVTSNWTGGNFITQNGWAANVNDPGAPNRHQLIDRLSNPPLDKWGGFPVVHPRGGRYSLKLGSDEPDFTVGYPNARTESVRYKIRVPKNDFALLISYAVVFENPRNGPAVCGGGHCENQQPRFKAAIYNLSGDTLQCFNFTFIASDPLPGFMASPLSGNLGSLVKYRPWTDVFINLSKYKDSEVYLEITSADCTLRGHWGYGYFDVIECDYKLQLQNSCDPLTNNTVLKGPDGPFKNYTWINSATKQVLGTGKNLNIKPALPDNTKLELVLEPFDGYGCKDTLTAVVNQPTPPDFKLGPTQPNCGNSGVLIGIPPVSTYTYEWTPATGLSSTNTSQVIAKPTVQTKYKLKVTDTETGCSRLDSTIVQLYPAVSFRVDPKQTCINQPVELEAKTTGNKNYSYTWKPSTWLNTSTGEKVTSKPLRNIDYFVTAKDNNTGCAETIKTNVSIITSLQITSRVINPFDCNAKKGTIILSGLNPQTLYLITYTKNGRVVPDNSYISNDQGEIEMTNLDIGTYTNIFAEYLNCASNTVGPIVIFAPQQPLKPYTPVKEYTYCPGQLTSLVEFVSTDNSIIGWTNNNPNIGLMPTGVDDIAPFVAKNNTKSPIEATIITRAFLNGCPGPPDTLKIIVNPLPEITATGGEACAGGSVTLNASGADVFTWSPVNNLNITTGSSVTASPTSTTTYTVTGTNQTTGCSSTANAVATINPLPEGSLLKTGLNLICNNGQFSFQVTGIRPAGTAVQWVYNGQPIQGATGTTYQANKEGLYTASLTSPNGCKANVDGSIELQHFKKPEAAFRVSPGCIGNPIRFENRTDLTQSGLIIWEWDFGNGQKSTQANPIVVYTKGGSYNVKLFVSSQQCTNLKDTAEAIVLIKEPIPGIRYPSIDALSNTSIPLEARNIGTIYQWIPSTGLNNPNIRKPVFNYNKDIEYLIRISTAEGCETLDTIFLRMHDNAQILVPTGFSPNGDGNNDFLDVFLLGFKKIHFWVFNRWGQLMFETTDPKQRWDGRLNGKPQPLENYVWIAEGETYSGKIIRQRGQTVLIR